MAVYGRPSILPATESATLPEPIASYGIGKLTAEHYVRYFANAIKRRRRGRVIRLELETGMPEPLAAVLREELGGAEAIVTESGAWMNDPEETKLVNVFTIDWSWPALDPADRGDVLLTHGGPNDVTVLNVFNLEEASKAALPFLAAAERTVVDCAHDKGHTLAPDVTPEIIAKFLTAHRAGEPSPYAGGMLPGFPASCTLRLP